MIWNVLSILSEAEAHSVQTLGMGSALKPLRPGSFYAGPPAENVTIVIPAKMSDKHGLTWYLNRDIKVHRPPTPQGGWNEAALDRAVIEASKTRQKGTIVAVAGTINGEEVYAFYGGHKFLVPTKNEVPEKFKQKFDEVEQMFPEDPQGAAQELGIPEDSYVAWKAHFNPKQADNIVKAGIQKRPASPWTPPKDSGKKSAEKSAEKPATKEPSAWEKLLQKQDPTSGEETPWMKRALGKEKESDPNYPSFEKGDDQFKSPEELKKLRDKEAHDRDIAARLNAPASKVNTPPPPPSSDSTDYKYATPKSAATKVRRKGLFR